MIKMKKSFLYFIVAALGFLIAAVLVFVFFPDRPVTTQDRPVTTQDRPVTAQDRPVTTQQGSCTTVDLKGELSSINSMAWHPDGKNVIITDPIRGKVHVISPRDGSFRPSGFTKATEVLRKPYLGFRSGDKYVQLGIQQLLWFDRNMRQMSRPMSKITADVGAASSYDIFHLSFMYDVAAQGGRALVYAAGERPDAPGDYMLGFYEYELRPGGATPQARLIQWHEPDDFHALGHPYITATGDGFFYFLTMGETPQLWKYSWGNRVAEAVHVEGLAKIFDKRLPWNFNVRSQMRPETYAKVEGFEIPVGLFSQGPFLYLLYREPTTTGKGTVWTMFRLQVEAGVAEVLGEMELPVTQSAHISVLPGAVDWVVALKSSVHPDGTPRKNGTQKISQFLIISAKVMAASKGCA